MSSSSVFARWSSVFAFGAMALATACGSSEEAKPSSPVTPPATTTEATDPSSPAADASVGSDAGTPSSPPGVPFTAPEREWTWVEVPGTTCADGTTTGLGVNLTKDSDDVLVFLEGGGACWDGTSCWGPVSTSFAIATGFGKLQWDTDPQRAMIYLVDRSNADNPFKDKNLVYIPYCTGDVFAGDAVKTLNFLGIDHETHFAGRKNIKVFLERLVATFPKAKRVWLSGDSAGGFGAALSFGVFQDAFTAARVDVLDDSGQPVDPDPATWTKWKDAWNMQLPADCAACGDSPTAFVEYYRVKYPQSRFGLISYENDIIISPFMNLSLGTFNKELMALATSIDGNWTNGRYFLLSGGGHVGMFAASTALKKWVTAFASDDPAWASVRP